MDFESRGRNATQFTKLPGHATFHLLHNMADEGTKEVSQDQGDGSTQAKVEVEGAAKNEEAEESKAHSSTVSAGSSKKSAKKNRKKAKKAEGATAAVTAPISEQAASRNPDLPPSAVDMKTLKQIQRAMEQMMVVDKPARSKSEAKQRTYQFWNTQPVPKIGSYTGYYFMYENPCRIIQEVLFSRKVFYANTDLKSHFIACIGNIQSTSL